jgi:acetyltransferase-like isoleucine patch superfamily enzyme
MPSSLFRKIKLRVLDESLALLRRPNRIDTAAVVSPLARVTESSLHGPVRVSDFATLHQVEAFGSVSIGRNSSLWGPGIHVLARGAPIAIGNFCSVARNVSFHGYSHDPARISTHYIGRNILGRSIEEEVLTRGPITVGHDVWIGAGAHVMSGVTIGTGAIVGAGSVVTRDVPSYAIVAGSPAVVVKFRFDDAIIHRLEASQWWNWSHDQIRAKEPLFTRPLTPELLDEYL